MLKSNKIHLFFTAIFLLFLCLMTYGDILTHQFMIDERIYVKSAADSFNRERIYLNPTATIYTYYQNLGDFFKKSIGHHYAPLNFLLNVALFQLFGNPFPLYLINLLLFYIDCGLLFVFVYLISEDFLTALLTSVIFCIHPMTGDMLQHITFNILFIQNILIASGLIALYLYAKQNRHILYYFFSFLMIFIALFCQETTLLFPLYAAALLFFLTDLEFRRIIKLIIPFVFLSLLLIVLWLLIVNPHVQLEKIVTLSPRFFWSSSANFSRLFFWYLSNLFIPQNIVFMASMPPLKDFIWLWNLLFFCFLTGCGLLIFCYFKKSLEAFALVLFLTGFIFAVVGAQARFQVGEQWVFEPNWIYFSSIGFYLFFVLLLLKLRKHINKPLFSVLVSVLFIFYFVATLNLNITSRTERSYSENWLRKFPGNFIATNIVTSFYFNHKELEIPSDFISDMLNQVDIYIKEDVPETPKLIERISSCKISLTQRKELSFKLTAYYCKNGQNDKCKELIDRIVGPGTGPYTYIQLAYTLYRSQANKTAIALLKQCISLYPKYKEPYLLIGVILGNEGNYAESINFWKQGLAIDPTDSRFLSNIDEAKYLINKRR